MGSEFIKDFVDKMKHGEHYCLIHRNKREQFDVIIPFIVDGLNNNEKCIYLVGQEPKNKLITALTDYKIDVEHYLETHQLDIITDKDSYLLEGGTYGPDMIISVLKQAEQDVLHEGYAGIRLTGEMSWVHSKLPGTELLLEYKNKLESFFHASRIIAICQYNENGFSPKFLADVIAVHPKVILYSKLIADNPFYVTNKLSTGESGQDTYEKIKDKLLEVSKHQSKNIHFIGVGGIGMSGLAQFFRWLGYNVSGSDRAIDRPENKELFEKLEKQGVKLYPQDGSYIKNEQTDIIVYSTAVEDDNSDLLAGKGLPHWHRSEALAFLIDALDDKESIAVTGSCGKTTVSGWLGETLVNLKTNPVVLSGGMVNSFIDSINLGNFRHGDGNYFVYEADESDKSLLAFNPDYSLILNIGTDHYPHDELVEMFEQFLRQTKKGAVIEQKVYDLLNPKSYSHLKVQLFSTDADVSAKSIWHLKNYSLEDGVSKITCSKDIFDLNLDLTMPGVHNAANALSILALIDLLDLNNDYSDIASAVEGFGGVHRRFELVGKTKNGSKVYDDYSHNVEKIVSAISTAQEIAKGRVFTLFQPTGFKSFRFMRNKLFPALEDILRKDDKYIFMPVFYAGGTTSFTPTAPEVCEEYAEKSVVEDRYLVFDTRDSASRYLDMAANEKDVIIIMGARDESLALWAKDLVSA